MGTSNLIEINSSVRTYKVNKPVVVKMAESVFKLLGIKDHYVSISFVGSSAIRKLNTKYRKKNKPTDVLSFPQKEWKGLPSVGSKKNKSTYNAKFNGEVLGDIVISLPEALKNAKKIGQTFDKEVGFLLVHGILHLCGYDHLSKKDEEVMILEQKMIINRLAAHKPKALWVGCVRQCLSNKGS